MRWFTSDLHFGHLNIITFCARPYYNVHDMNMAMIDRINQCVEPDDELWIIGDVCMGKIRETLPFVSMLNGRKHLVPGNHDRCWPHWGQDKKRPEDWESAYEEQGLTIEPTTLTRPIRDEEVVICHFPYVGDSGHDERFSEFRPVDKGEWLVHGHTHGAWRQRGRMIDVGIDAWGGYPVSADEVLNLIVDGPNDLDRIPWTAT